MAGPRLPILTSSSHMLDRLGVVSPSIGEAHALDLFAINGVRVARRRFVCDAPPRVVLWGRGCDDRVRLARASALDLGPFGITVNCLCPGPFLTDLPGTLLSPEEKDAFANRTALKRWGQPRELAGPAIMLASDAGSYITGEALLVERQVVFQFLAAAFAEAEAVQLAEDRKNAKP
jgi:hypothetical protein